jgi:UDP-N-acetylmuramate dehydrogenase
MDKFESVLNKFPTKVLKDEPLSKYTTLGIGGPAKFLTNASSLEDLIKVISIATKQKIPCLVIGTGSDLLVSDDGFDGLIVVNKTKGIKEVGERIRVVSGTDLQEFIRFLVNHGFMGMEKMSGIPGTVGGAIYGNAGAYGQTISDRVLSVKIFDGKNVRTLQKSECDFGYRDSIFKIKKLLILEAEFEFEKASPEILKKESLNIIQMRSLKYPPTLKCPGSFFKNVIAERLEKSILKKIPSEKIVFGKVPAGYLMDTVGAKGQQKGMIKIADYHGNLIFNLGGGTAADFVDLAYTYAKKVKVKFGIKLEPEVQIIGIGKDFYK